MAGCLPLGSALKRCAPRAMCKRYNNANCRPGAKQTESYTNKHTYARTPIADALREKGVHS